MIVDIIRIYLDTRIRQIRRSREQFADYVHPNPDPVWRAEWKKGIDSRFHGRLVELQRLQDFLSDETKVEYRVLRRGG